MSRNPNQYIPIIGFWNVSNNTVIQSRSYGLQEILRLPMDEGKLNDIINTWGGYMDYIETLSKKWNSGTADIYEYLGHIRDPEPILPLLQRLNSSVNAVDGKDDDNSLTNIMNKITGSKDIAAGGSKGIVATKRVSNDNEHEDGNKKRKVTVHDSAWLQNDFL
eukprot:Pgem_evm1s2730